MNQDELIEKCRLTDEEIASILVEKCGLGHSNYWDAITVNDFRKFGEEWLRKAIPIIQKAERERIIRYLASCQTLPDEFYSPEAGEEIFAIGWRDWQALKGEGNG